MVAAKAVNSDFVKWYFPKLAELTAAGARQYEIDFMQYNYDELQREWDKI